MNEQIDIRLNFINDNQFSISNRDGVISVMGRISKVELYMVIRSHFFEVEKALNDVGYQITKKG